MRKLPIFLALFLPPALLAAPAEVHVASCSNNQGNSTTTYKCRLPEPALAGNLLLAFVQLSGGGTVTVADDKSDSFTADKSVSGGQIAKLFRFANATAGAQTITVSMTAGTFVGVHVFEFSGVATTSPLDVSCGVNTASGTSSPCGSMTTTVDGDLIFEACAQDSSNTNHETWTAGSGLALLTADKYDSMASQWEIQTTHGAINPTMTMTAGNSKTCVGAAYKAAAAGTAPSGMYVISMLHNSLGPDNGYTVGATTLQAPCAGGNLIVVDVINEPNITITSTTPTDANGNTWARIRNDVTNGSSGNLYRFYAANATTSATNTITFTNSGSQVSGDTVQIYCVAGAATSPYDSTAGAGGSATATGTETTAGALNTTTITPSTSSGIIFATTGVASNTVTACTPGSFVSAVPSPVSSPNDVDQNNSWCVAHYASTSSVTTQISGSGAFQDWASAADAFEAPAGAIATRGKAVIF